jgi:predicted DNA-binding transcriptional regulator YafY
MCNQQKAANPTGAGKKPSLRMVFDSRLKLEFHGSKITSDAGLLAYRELDAALGLTDLGDELLNDWRTGKNTQHSMVALTRFSLGSLDDALSFRPFAPEDTDLQTFEMLTRALKERRVLKFQYRNLDADKAQARLVHPYHLGCIDNHWYLFAFDVKRDAMRTFALPRLKSPELTADRFTIPRKFNLAEYLKGSLTVFKGDADYEIVVDFDSWGADLIRGRKWHASQEITELAKRQVRLRLRLNNIEEAERWVLSWGTHATVVRPQALANRLRDIGHTLQSRYQP